MLTTLLLLALVVITSGVSGIFLYYAVQSLLDPSTAYILTLIAIGLGYLDYKFLRLVLDLIGE